MSGVSPEETVRREGTGDLVFIGDVHLDRDDPDLDAFVGFLDRLEPTLERLVLIGDLFNLWIGSPDLEQPHHTRVIERLTAMRGRGVRVAYVEGNRDFRVKPYHEGGAFDEVVSGNLVQRFGGRDVLAAHGDLANTRDTQYRAWRSLSRSRPFWWLAGAVPRGRRFAVGEWLENRMRSTNRQQKRAFPEDEVRAHAARFFSEGHDTVVLGHFHVEKAFDARPPSPPGRVFVLPYWRDAHRYLRVTRDGDVRFESG